MVTCAGELLCRNEGSRMSLTCQVSQGTQVPQRTGRILPENQTETLPVWVDALNSKGETQVVKAGILEGQVGRFQVLVGQTSSAKGRLPGERQ